jgi:hypothetical protein
MIKTLGTDRIYLFDHFGSTSVDNIINRVRYLAKALGCLLYFPRSHQHCRVSTGIR